MPVAQAEREKHREIHADGGQDQAPRDAGPGARYPAPASRTEGRRRAAPGRSSRACRRRCAAANAPHPGAGGEYTPSRRSRRNSSAALTQAVSDVEAASTTCRRGEWNEPPMHREQRQTQRHADDQRDDRRSARAASSHAARRSPAAAPSPATARGTPTPYAQQRVGGHAHVFVRRIRRARRSWRPSGPRAGSCRRRRACRSAGSSAGSSRASRRSAR